MTEARLGGLLDLSTIDWPGRVCSVVFLAGCNLRCPFCQNASLVPIDSGRKVDTSTICDRITRNAEFIDAVGFCGGEPTLQGRALIEVCRHARILGLDTFVNTNGTEPMVIAKLANEGLVNLVTLDIKAPLDPLCYGRVTGVQDLRKTIVRKVEETLRTCQDMGISLEARTTIVPKFTDDPYSVKRISQHIPRDVRYVLQQFNPEGDILDQKFRELAAPSRDEMMTLAKVALAEGLSSVYIRTKSVGEERVNG